ncbi:MAG TPA: ASKHA domain-containing protein [Anaerolineales bacterium]|nr:ASKHA domain-containing protein [Anaerolineales bacterium]
MPDSTGDSKTAFQVALTPSGRQGQVPRGANLLNAARQLGVELESICGGRQTCFKCQVAVEEGRFPKLGLTSRADHLTPLTPQEETYFAEHNITGRRLACACQVQGDLLIAVPEESQARKQIIAKAATERAIQVDPAVRQVYVEVRQPSLEEVRGDWERLAEALGEQWDLHDLSIDGRALPALQSALRQGGFAVTVSLWQDREVLRVQPGYAEGVYGLAVDIGSTTVVAHLCDLRTGEVLATQAAMNPQVRYGEDLMSRVSYAMSEPQGLARLHRAVILTLNELAEKAAASAGVSTEDVLDAVVVGNTVMHHIFLGINPVELGGAPFALAVDSPLDLRARDLGLSFNPAARLHLLPIIAGHVGADNVAVQLAEEPYAQDETMLIVDVGTNAEIVLGDRERVLVASSPTGPAFEGAQISHGQRAAPGAVERVRIDPQTLEPFIKVIGYPDWIAPGSVDLPEPAKATGICGSGIIEAVAELYLAGLINADGRFERSAAEVSPRLLLSGRTAEYLLADADQTATGSPIVITQNDVRAIQLAKAALYAGIKLLMAARGVERVDRVVLAGAFGSFISPYHAMVLGLIPDCELEHVYAVGNAAGDGARIALLNRRQREKASWLARWAEHVQMPLEASFQEEFVAALALPHARDPFPHLADSLPEASEERKARPRHRIREKYNKA